MAEEARLESVWPPKAAPGFESLSFRKTKPGALRRAFLESMKARRIIRIVLAVLVAAILAGCLYLNSLMCIITGYAAKNLCSAVFVSGRAQHDVENLDLDFSFIKYNRNKVDYDNKTVTSRFLWGKSTAAYRDGYGVTLLRGKTAKELAREEYPLPAEPACDPDTVLWPGGNMIPDDIRERDIETALEPLAASFVDDHAYNGTPFAFVVLHKGIPVAERYREGIGRSTPLLSWSMAKSFTNALAGIMAGDGLVDVNAPMDISEWQGDGRKDITLNDLMQMQSGLEWNEDYGNRSDVNLMLHREKDMGLYAQSKPLGHEPGTFWYYSSGNTNILMRYLRGRFSSDEEFLGYMRDRLFTPLGIRNPRFEPDMSGTPVASSYLYATALDFARFGLLYLQDGCAGGERILPEGWVGYSATPASCSEGKYGSGFWLNRDGHYADVPSDMFSCNGHDGQQIFIIPSKELVVVVLGYSPKPDRVIDFNRLLRDIIGIVG